MAPCYPPDSAGQPSRSPSGVPADHHLLRHGPTVPAHNQGVATGRGHDAVIAQDQAVLLRSHPRDVPSREEGASMAQLSLEGGHRPAIGPKVDHQSAQPTADSDGANLERLCVAQ